jgi:hypothetical protein
MRMGWESVTICFKRMGMNYFDTINNMDMIKESITPEKAEKENQEKIL